MRPSEPTAALFAFDSREINLFLFLAVCALVRLELDMI